MLDLNVCAVCGHHLGDHYDSDVPAGGRGCRSRRNDLTLGASGECDCPGFQPPFYDLSGLDIDCVLDTNAFIETATLYDLNKAVADGSDVATIRSRFDRRRDALFLALFLNWRSARSFGLQEAHRILESRIPPQQAGQNFDHDFLVFHLHVVGDRLLTGWQHQVPVPADTAKGTKADNVVLNTARQNGLPLITTEGVTTQGVVDTGLRKKAKALDVRVFSPKQYYSGHCDEMELAEEFMERLAQERPHEIERRRKQFGESDNGDALFQMIQDAYRALLYRQP